MDYGCGLLLVVIVIVIIGHFLSVDEKSFTCPLLPYFSLVANSSFSALFQHHFHCGHSHTVDFISLSVSGHTP